jgi:hypothetical protein
MSRIEVTASAEQLELLDSVTSTVDNGFTVVNLQPLGRATPDADLIASVYDTHAIAPVPSGADLPAYPPHAAPAVALPRPRAASEARPG